jgi:hypothetical protein
MEAKRVSALQLSYKDFPYKFEPKHSKYVNEKTYKKILKSFYTKLAYYLITSGQEIVLPSRLGSLQAMKYKPKSKKVDFKNTEKYYGEYNKDKSNKDKKIIYHNNRITNGYLPRIHWSKIILANFKNKKKWGLTLTRPNVRPNSYNKNNPKVSLIPFFQKKGYQFYEAYNPYLKRQLHERFKDRKSSSSASSDRESTDSSSKG